MPRKCDPMTASVIEQVKTDLVTQQCDPCPIASFESSAEMQSRVPPTPTVSEAAFKGFPVGLYPRYSLESGPHSPRQGSGSADDTQPARACWTCTSHGT